MEQIKLEATNEQTPPERLRELAKINPTLASLVANNPNASPQLLRKLADRKEDFIRKNVAANPNTPMEVLWKLGEEFPTEVLENAVFPLLLLENPNLMEEIPYHTMMSFIECSAVPISFIEWAIVRSMPTVDFALKLATSCQTPLSILKALLHSQYSEKEIFEESQLHINYAGELKEDWREEFSRQIAPCIPLTNADTNEQYNFKNEYFFHNLAAIGLVPKLFFKELAREEQIKYRNPVASKEKLGLDSNARTRKELEELVEGIMLYNSTRVTDLKKIVATNPNTPVYLLKELYYQSSGFNGILAGNPSTPKYLLERFAYSLEESIRKTLASNPKIPQSAIHLLAKDENSQVRYALAKNPRTPLAILLELGSDTDALVRKVVTFNPKVSLDISAQTSATPKPSFSNHSFWRKLFDKIKKQCNVLKLYMPSFLICKNILISERECLELIGCGNTPATKALLRYLRKKPERLSALLELILMAFGSDLTRTIALWHPQMPAKVLVENARSLNWLERCAIAQNSNTPTETLQLLAADSNRIVRAAAKENLERILNT